MKKLSLILVIIMLAMSIMTSLPSISFANTQRANVTHDQLNVRSGPGTGYSVIGSANTGNSFAYLGSSNDSSGTVWYKIQYSAAAVGFISSAYAKLSTVSSPAPAPTPTPSPAPTIGKLTINADPFLNVRAGGGTQYKILGTLKNGSQVEYYSLSNGWYQIKYGTGKGYISSAYAKVSTQPAPAPTPKPTPAPTPTPTPSTTTVGKVKTTAGLGLNVRTQPSTSGQIIGALAMGSVVEYYKLSNGWYEINYQGKRAFISASYAQVVTTAPAPAPTPTPTPKPIPTPTPTPTPIQVAGKLKTTAGLGLNVRSLPNTTSTILGSLPLGSVVEYYSLSNGWYQIKYGTGKGYISSTFAQVITAAPTPTPNPTPTPTPAPAPVVKGKVTTNASAGLNVRAQANTTSTVLGTLAYGTIVEYYSLNNGWYQIKYKNTVGYISAAYATEVKTTTTPAPDTKPVTSISHELFPVASSYQLSVPIIITARGIGPSSENVAYKFSLKNKDTGEVLITQAYSGDDALIWTPSVTGTYSVVIEAKNKTASATQATSSLVLVVNNTHGVKHSYSIDFYGKTIDQAVVDQLAVNGRAVTDASGRWIQATKEQVMAAMNPVNYIPFDYSKEQNSLGFLTVTHDGLNVRPFAAVTGTPVGTVSTGEQFKVLDIFNEWYQIEFGEKIGWVHGNYVSYKAASDNTSPEYALVELSTIPKEMYQFLDLRHYTGLTSSTLNNVLKGKGILEGQGASFVDASKSAGINEVYLIAHAFLETGNGTSQLANGFWYDPVEDDILPYGSDEEEGYVKVYNMFGIGAIDAGPVSGGVRFAYQEGWTTPAKAIIGGAQWIGKSYINSETRAQYTLYTMKWNMYDNSHQYATDIGWAAKQTNQMYSIYSQATDYSLKFVLPQFNVVDQPQ